MLVYLSVFANTTELLQSVVSLISPLILCTVQHEREGFAMLDYLILQPAGLLIALLTQHSLSR